MVNDSVDTFCKVPAKIKTRHIFIVKSGERHVPKEKLLIRQLVYVYCGFSNHQIKLCIKKKYSPTFFS